MTPRAREVPPLAKPRKPRLPAVAERVLDNGLRVVAVRRGGVPMVHARLRIPFAGRKPEHLPKRWALDATMLHGTAEHSRTELAVAMQEIGGALSVGTDADRLQIRGESLAKGLPRMLELIGEVVTSAAYPSDAVAGEVERLQTVLRQRLSQPAEVAAEALRHRLYDGHPYGRDLPTPDEVAGVTAAAVRSLHRRWVVPAGSLLVLVGDITPARALDHVEARLQGWSGKGTARLPKPDVPVGGGLTLVDRPGAVQSNIRLGGPALPRTDDPAYAAMSLANVVFGGYFASRLVQNIREDKGYTYSPRSGITHGDRASAVVVEADVATEVTAPALVEIAYELGRVATTPVTAEELDSAAHYTSGILALQTATQSGLASTLEDLLADGLDVSWLRTYPERLARVTTDEVREQAQRHFAPARLATVVVGDASRVQDELAGLAEVVPADGV
ncbi:MAG: zinc protease [Actinomycetota bacterium]|nr:zinc protease [Actinomycetota bacterium]